MRFSSFFPGICVLFVCPAATHAADMPVQIASQTSNHWSGIYVGAYGGIGDAQASSFRSVPALPLSNTVFYQVGGYNGGVRGGLNVQFQRLVLGFEGDIAIGQMEGSGTNPTQSNDHRTRIEQLSTARVRLGFAFQQLLVYGTGGAAWGRIVNIRTQLAGTQGNATPGTVETSTSEERVWTAGGGFEFMIAPRWSLTGEYLYMPFFTHPIFLISQREEDVPVKLHTVKIGLNLHF